MKAELSRKSVLALELNAYLESTGGLEENLFLYLKKTGARVRIITPKQSKKFKEALFEDQISEFENQL